MEIDWKIIDSHEQKYENSCIPSAVEIILKLLKKVDSNYYVQQSQWKKIVGFAYYHGQQIEDVTFKLRNNMTVDKLFAEIDRELKESRYVIISLKSTFIDPTQPQNKYHMYVIYDYDEKKKDYKAFTKNWQETRCITNVREVVKAMGTTDILVYS